MNFVDFSDEKLLRLCTYYGEQARAWRQKFIGLLPEVNRRRLYEQKGFRSIFEFAFKLAGLTEEQVRRTLNLEKTFQTTPALHKILVNGEVSMNKLARVASIATPENEKILAEQIKLLPSRALETLVRDERRLQDNENALQKPLFDVHVHTQTPELAEDVKLRLNELQQKGIDINELLRKFLDQREEEIENEKEQLAEKTNEATSRTAPVSHKKLIKKEHGIKCAALLCQKASEQIHHTNRFALSHNHNPYYLAPLCKDHHQIAHTIDVKACEVRWR